jgi:ribonuclease HI
MSKQKYYVVWRGREPGIYDTWREAKEQIDGFKHARYKSFDTLEDAAEAYVAGPPPSSSLEVAYERSLEKAARKAERKVQREAKAAETEQQRKEQRKRARRPVKPPLDPAPRTVIYCDGAADPNPGPTGTGLAVYRDGTLEALHYGLYRERGTNNIGELHGVLHALRLAKPYCEAGETVQIAADSDYAIRATSDWVYKWKADGWKRGKKGVVRNLQLVQRTHALYEELFDQVELVHVKAHSGIEGNELADRMAMLAIARQEASLTPYKGPLDVAAVLALPSG